MYHRLEQGGASGSSIRNPRFSENFTEKMTMTKLHNRVCDAAREYVDSGWSCFPLSLNKRPLNKWMKFQTEYPTGEMIDDWEDNGAPCSSDDGSDRREEEFNLAVVTGAISGIVVVDCDNEEALKYATEKGLTSAISVKTTRGAHFYFRHPNNGRRFQNKTGGRSHNWPQIKGLDFRGDGGYVVAPPSVSLNDDGTIKHEYRWSIPEGIDYDDMPTWTGTADDMVVTDTMDFSSLDLSSVKIETSFDVEEQVARRVAHLNRKLIGPDCGDATDDWMIRFCGQAVRRGMDEEELWNAIRDFHGKYFEYHGSPEAKDRWLRAKMKSAVEMDRRNHPDDYDGAIRRDPEAAKELIASKRIPIYARDVDRVLSSIGDVGYYMDSAIPAGSIVQVAGYNGHGKSFFTMGMMSAMASGQREFGPFICESPNSKVLYLDFDNPARTVLTRMKKFGQCFGDTGDNLALWSPAIIGRDDGGHMDLRTPKGQDTLGEWIDATKPNVVVIDTVRNAFPGLDERLPQEWIMVNSVAKIIRDHYKATVVLVHHRNKPTVEGLGRESGSTAQLTDLDTQIFVTQVYDDENVAKKKAGVYNGDLTVHLPGGYSDTPYSYLTKKMDSKLKLPRARLRMVSEIGWGKLRNETDMHKTYYIGWVEDLDTGEQHIVSTPSPRQIAETMFGSGRTPKDIAMELMIPSHEIKRWLKITSM